MKNVHGLIVVAAACLAGCATQGPQLNREEGVRLNIEQIRQSQAADYEYCSATLCPMRTQKTMRISEPDYTPLSPAVNPEVSHAKPVVTQRAKKKKVAVKKHRKGGKPKKKQPFKYICVKQPTGKK